MLYQGLEEFQVFDKMAISTKETTNMRKIFNQIIEKHYKLDSLICYIFIAFFIIRLLIAFPGLPNYMYTIGQIIHIILGVLLLFGIAIAFICGLVKMKMDKKAVQD